MLIRPAQAKKKSRSLGRSCDRGFSRLENSVQVIRPPQVGFSADRLSLQRSKVESLPQLAHSDREMSGDSVERDASAKGFRCFVDCGLIEVSHQTPAFSSSTRAASDWRRR